MLRIDQEYYPETLSEHFIINSPYIFSAIWSLIKGWLDPVTAAKFHILGADYAGMLRERIKPEHLLQEYGGTNPYELPHVDCNEAKSHLRAAELEQGHREARITLEAHLLASEQASQ